MSPGTDGLRTVHAAAIPIIDADAHLTEPADLWTSRISSKWGDQVPHLHREESTGDLRWRIGGILGGRPGFNSHGGWKEFLPSIPPDYDSMHPACYDPHERLLWMDDNGIQCQVLYPNLLAFEGHAVMKLAPQLQLEVIRAYNDFLVDFASSAPERFVLISALPFWDIDASIAEIRRCRASGHRGILWGARPEKHGLPDKCDQFWDPFYAEVQDLGLSINFHVGVGNTTQEMTEIRSKLYDPAAAANGTAIRSFLGNAQTIADIITTGLCHRFPRLNFVSVEGGFGYVPFLLEALDWQWQNNGGGRVYPDRLLPSEYFFRQIYTMFWFEDHTLEQLPKFQNNVLFETDFPHPTSLSPGSGSVARRPGDITDGLVERFGPDMMRKVLWETPARLYHVN